MGRFVRSLTWAEVGNRNLETLTSWLRSRLESSTSIIPVVLTSCVKTTGMIERRRTGESLDARKIAHVLRSKQAKIRNRGLVAQGIERLRPKEGVGGSSPSEAATKLEPKMPVLNLKRAVQKAPSLKLSGEVGLFGAIQGEVCLYMARLKLNPRPSEANRHF